MKRYEKIWKACWHMLHKPLSCSPFRIVRGHCWSCGRIALCSSALALALNLLTSMVCHWCVLAMWRHSTLANSRTNWDKVGPECSCKHCKLQFVLNSKISKGPILPRSNRGKAASQFFMSLKVFARRFRETATIISQGTAIGKGFDTKDNLSSPAIWVPICCLSSASHNLHTCSNLAEA